jgi:hypothetical protein
MIPSYVIDRGQSNRVVGVLLGMMLLVGGCQSQTVTHEQAQSVLLSRMDVRQQLNLTKAQLDATVAALNEINGKQADGLVGAFTKYGDQVDLLDGSIAQLDHASTAAKAQAEAYFETAATKIALIDDPDLKTRATARHQTAVDLAQTIDTDTKTVELTYRRFLQRLRDIQAYLAADLTSGCVRSIQDQFAQTNLDVDPLKAKSDQLAFDLELGNELMNTGEVKSATTSATVPATEPTATLPSFTTAP